MTQGLRCVAESALTRRRLRHITSAHSEQDEFSCQLYLRFFIMELLHSLFLVITIFSQQANSRKFAL